MIPDSILKHKRLFNLIKYKPIKSPLEFFICTRIETSSLVSNIDNKKEGRELRAEEEERRRRKNSGQRRVGIDAKEEKGETMKEEERQTNMRMRGHGRRG